ncbi:hypothetical protein [Micromonospora sp. NPDC005172]|uniref:hypothetical protein n=1 Tax=Micromonospora sp. NPDC005172 TaxID=3156867 RepID=UPI0033A7367B
MAAGAAIANLHWAQPLLSFIAEDLDAPTATAGWLVTATQIGYAVGVLLLVPLGDILDRRRHLTRSRPGYGGSADQSWSGRSTIGKTRRTSARNSSRRKA